MPNGAVRACQQGLSSILWTCEIRYMRRWQPHLFPDEVIVVTFHQSVNMLSCALFAGFAALAAALPTQPSSEEAATPQLFPRATSFKCPVYPRDKASETCTEDDIIWDNRSVGGKSVTLYFTANDPIISAASSAQRAAARKLIEDATNRALTYYQNWAKGLKVYLGVVGELEGMYGATLPTRNSTTRAVEHCDIIMVYPDDTADPVQKLRMLKVVVHELYHCIQWWVEGSARYFDGVLYPPQGITDPSLLELGAFAEEYNPKKSLVEQTYEAALYYHFLEQSGVSADKINAWISSKTARGSFEDELLDAASTPILADHWHAFAEAFADHGIFYAPDNHIELSNPLPSVPITITVPDLHAGAAQSYAVDIPPFTFDRARLTFPAGTQHRVGLPSGKGFECSYRQAGTATWKQFGDAASFNVKAGGNHLSVDILCSCNAGVLCQGRVVAARS
ncbi:hypothetical protein B0T16DRAFT_125316 [Cercophora newfieldiana]|uniref:Uncharacterized protein n=1 Tax=Cercophora newfieldiana TaxID=92897 RepID=A0AA40CRY7_9PEZI|nr:hypothetical protein B0T16DRAFT_125316 [Cercophora newfieldiana]